jgi:amino acid transporter
MVAVATGAPPENVAEKGLKSGALGLISSIVMGVASTAPAYSLAATLGYIAVKVNLLSPLVVLIAFVPMLLVSIGYSEMNKADPDCGTTFTWATRAFGPKAGWYGGWAILAADILVMASLAQVAGQYVFLLFNTSSIGSNAASGWVLLVGVIWMILMTYICYRGIEVSAMLQRFLLGIEVVMLLVLSIVAFVKLGEGKAPPGHISPRLSWFNPADIGFSSLIGGMLLMIFIYWGWDTAVSVNEETKDRNRNPGLAAIISTVILLGTYFLVTLSTQSYAGIGTTGVGLENSANSSDVLSVLGNSIFGTSGFGSALTKLLLLMVLSSAAASTQTTILPTARTTLSMATYHAIPKVFAKMHKKYFTPTVSTVTMGAVSLVTYVWFNYESNGNVIPDAVTAIGVYIGLYYGLTGISCAWYYRKVLRRSARDLWMKGILPALGGVMLWFFLVWALYTDYNFNNTTEASYTSWSLPFKPHSVVGGAFTIAIVTGIVGLVLMGIWTRFGKDFFQGRTLNRDTPTLVPDDGPAPMGVPTSDPLGGPGAND